MFWKKKEEKEIDISTVKVTLKPIGKIQPGTYLTVLYGFIILAVLFAVFFLPGLQADGTYITFTAQPVKAGIWIDGVKVGVTPCQVLVKKGRRTIEFKKSFYKTVVMEREVGDFIFSLPFLPKKESMGAEMEIGDIDGLMEWSLSDFASWTMMDEFSSSYQAPPILSETVKSIRGNLDESGKQKLGSFLERSLVYVNSHFFVRELISAYAVLETGKGVFTQATLAALAKKYLQLSNAYETFSFWIYNLLPANIDVGTKKIASPEMELLRAKASKYGFWETPWFIKTRKKYTGYLAAFITQVYGSYGADLYAQGLHFAAIPAGVFIMGKSDDLGNLADPSLLTAFPHPLRVEAFYLSADEITNRQFKAFLDENPAWRPSARDELRLKTLVDQEYLKDWQNDTYPAAKAEQPVTNISYFAARAYCEWFTQKVKALGLTARLPYEGEWEWAAGRGNPGNFKVPGSVFFSKDIQGPGRAGSSNSNIQGTRDMAGNVWEWCNDWYAPTGFLLSSQDPQKNNVAGTAVPYGSLKTIRGGSWANKSEEIELYTRGSQPPHWCADFTGFRLVLVKQ